MTENAKSYDPRDKTLKFVTRPDDLTLDDDPDILRAEMSCGHAVTPQSLTKCCRLQLEEGQYKFKCPALKNAKTFDQCGAKWLYKEVRKMALLTQEEKSHFEESMAVQSAADDCEFKSCPRCKSFVEREDLTNLCVHCIICTAERGKTYEFCWQCLKKWKGPGPRSDRCENDGCINPFLKNLLTCDYITLPEVQNIKVPSLRACPTARCGNVVEHDRTGCKNIRCNRCRVEFCFSCLKFTHECLRSSTPFIPCSDGVAPQQTFITS